MTKTKISFLSGSLLWFGAAISIAEILTGSLLAPLGFQMGMLSIILGHLIGCGLLFAAGLIGANSQKSAMETVRFAFGKQGSMFFSILNVLQLIGWTAIMIISGARAFGAIVNDNLGFTSDLVWCILIGALIILWLMVGIKNVGKINLVAVTGLLILCGILAAVVFQGESNYQVEGFLSFGMALELSIAMPLSWLPLISDYTKNTDKPFSFTMFSTVCYFFGSCLMYAIGLGGALFMGSSDLVVILSGAGLGVVAMLIVILSTVTTTFLDVYSAGESILNINGKLNGKVLGVIICLLGTAIAMFTPIEQYDSFLYLIGSVFVPMITILITDYFILGKASSENQSWNIGNLAMWLVGFVIYRVFMQMDAAFGSTIPVVIILIILCVIKDKVTNLVKKEGKNYV